VTFGSPLNIVRASEEVKAASANVLSAEENGIIGASRDVVLTVNGNERVYTFTQGKGDCPAGCIETHFWRATIGPDGGLTIVEGGDPL
jgi:hypothetical protein